MKRVYLHPLPLRIWHWVNALLVLVLLITGIQLRIPGIASLRPQDPALLDAQIRGLGHGGFLCLLGRVQPGKREPEPALSWSGRGTSRGCSARQSIICSPFSRARKTPSGRHPRRSSTRFRNSLMEPSCEFSRRSWWSPGFSSATSLSFANISCSGTLRGT